MKIVCAVDDAEQLLREVDRLREAGELDLVITDVRMPPTHTDEGLRAALVIRSRHPELPILVLSQYVEERYAADLLGGRTRGVGYLLKDRVADVEDFLAALRRVAEGGTALDPDVVAQLLARTRQRDPLGELTPREREVLGLMAEGRSNAAISRQLVISSGAVEKHVTSVFTKLGLEPDAEDHRRVLAVLRYLGGVQGSST
jgi:DNA-binding NarL/FixJ family response regulator